VVKGNFFRLELVLCSRSNKPTLNIAGGNTLSSNLPINIASTQQINTDVDNFSQGLTRYLDQLGLPSSNVLVNPEERFTVIANLPTIVNRLSVDLRTGSMYISKFVAACGAGLFDAALNMLWNETVVNLREKVKRFDMNYFLDSVVTDSRRRSTFRTEEDLKKLEEWELVKGCKDTGIITDIGFKHLDYIREMRNHASAAHPNHVDLTGFQLVSWLDTCIREVLAKEPEGPVLQVRQLLSNLRSRVLSRSDIPPITANIQLLPRELVNSTLRAIFGMYTDDQLEVQIRNNLNLVAPALWNNSSTQSKHEIGLKYAIFSANAELDRKAYASEFLTLVNGLSFMPADLRAIEMDQTIDDLFRAHYGWNNFYNEPTHARILASYIPANGDIPETISEKYVKVLTLCRIGNGSGISTDASVYYDNMLSKFSDVHFLKFVLLLWEVDVQSRLGNTDCSRRYMYLAGQFAQRAINQNLKDVHTSISNSSGVFAGTPLPRAHQVKPIFDAVDRIIL
jgi:hypothetical protein